jgi:hypothetical protein
MVGVDHDGRLRNDPEAGHPSSRPPQSRHIKPTDVHRPIITLEGIRRPQGSAGQGFEQ